MIGLMDCNNFFVSCERLFRPDLLKKPVAVLSSNDGCVVARSVEVKDLGVPMGIPYFQVKEVLTKADATLFSSNFTLYRDISSRVMQALQDEVGFCEVYSIDEAFFELKDDVTSQEVKQVRDRVIQKVGIPVSIGVARTKTLAKQASRIAKKKGGICIITPEILNTEVYPSVCGSVWGLGGKTTAKLRSYGVTTIAQFLALQPPFVRSQFGVVGERIMHELSGTSVYSLGQHTNDIQQSIMSTRSFEKTTTVQEHLESALAYHIEEVAMKLRHDGLCARELSILILPSRHGDYFMRAGRAHRVLAEATNSSQELLHEALVLLREVYEAGVPYKKAGVVVSGLIPAHATSGNLFEIANLQEEKIDAVLDVLNSRFGHGTVHTGLVGANAARGSAKLRSKEYTTQWKDIPTVRA